MVKWPRMVRTFRYRVKDKHVAALNRQARAVSFVWNFLNETQRTAVQRGNRWPSAFDLMNLTVGCSKELGITAGSIQQVCLRYVASQRAAHRKIVRFRGRHSLGWIPFRGENLSRVSGQFKYYGHIYTAWFSRPLPHDARIVDGGSFSADSRGRWYINVAVEETAIPPRSITTAVGIDLGLKDLATLSTGEKVAAQTIYRRAQERLALAQRANKARLERTIHAKIGNQRRDFNHKLSTRLVRDFDLIAVGDVSSSSLARTSFAKSVLDAGWSTLRRMLSYKAIAQGVTYREVSERGSTQTCSDCGLVGGPKGREGLVVREWTCAGCGVVHDRDLNAAQNILRWGYPAPTGAPAR